MNLEYQDSIRFIETTSTAYGNEVYAGEADVAAIFEQATGWRHSTNADNLDGNATAFVDPDDAFVQANANRLEGMLLIANDIWYRVINVQVFQATQLGNEIDNVQLTLKKSAGLTGIS